MKSIRFVIALFIISTLAPFSITVFAVQENKITAQQSVVPTSVNKKSKPTQEKKISESHTQKTEKQTRIVASTTSVNKTNSVQQKKTRKKQPKTIIANTNNEKEAKQPVIATTVRKKISDSNYEELKVVKEQLIAKGYKESAIKYIEKMVPLCTDLGELADLMLELADILFDLGSLIKAERLYGEFVHLYPGDKKAEYASYKEILCSYWKTLEYFRDQSKTKETVDLAKKFLERKDVFVTYKKQVQEIMSSCYEKLLDSEINIFNFYLKQENYTAARTRLANIEKEFLPLLPEKEPILITLACNLAEQQNDKQLLTSKKLELATKFPEFEKQKEIVASAKDKKAFANKF